MEIWNNQELLSQLEEQRDQLRLAGKRMTFDCLNNLFKEDRVFCSRGKLLGQSKDGSMALITVLKGICSGACSSCEYFNTEKEED